MLEKNAATIVQADIENLYKGSFVREGYFKDVDAALSAHPGVGHHLTEKTLLIWPDSSTPGA